MRRQSQLSEAVESRTVIGEAIGLLMQRYQIERERAFQSVVTPSWLRTDSEVTRREGSPGVLVEQVTQQRPRHRC
ncbi:MAG: hypothetical protein QOK15_197, partial [Nocardioidaceae bacterium]|nr:hypothetical protein [Nocardioidaceae bacterium]